MINNKLYMLKTLTIKNQINVKNNVKAVNEIKKMSQWHSNLRDITAILSTYTREISTDYTDS